MDTDFRTPRVFFVPHPGPTHLLAAKLALGRHPVNDGLDPGRALRAVETASDRPEPDQRLVLEHRRDPALVKRLGVPGESERARTGVGARRIRVGWEGLRVRARAGPAAAAAAAWVASG